MRTAHRSTAKEGSWLMPFCLVLASAGTCTSMLMKTGAQVVEHLKHFELDATGLAELSTKAINGMKHLTSEINYFIF